jgi:hypothetical protein
MSSTVETAVSVAGEEERVGDLATELAGDVHIADEPDDERTWHIPPCRSEYAGLVDLEDFGLSIDHESQRPLVWAGSSAARMTHSAPGNLR